MKTSEAKPIGDPETSSAFAMRLRLARQGTTTELGGLLDEFRDYLRSIAQQEIPETIRSKLGNSDAVQETIVRGYRQFATFEGHSREQLAGWLRQILINYTRNVAKSYFTEKRDIAREQVIDPAAIMRPDQTPSQDALTRERRDLTDRALSQLPAEERSVIEMRHRDGRSFAEIASELGKSEDTIRRLWARAIQHLQLRLKSLESRG